MTFLPSDLKEKGNPLELSFKTIGLSVSNKHASILLLPQNQSKIKKAACQAKIEMSGFLGLDHKGHLFPHCYLRSIA